jgi:hypothetical protein
MCRDNNLRAMETKKFYCFFIMQNEGIESWVSLLDFRGARKKKRYLLTKQGIEGKPD